MKKVLILLALLLAFTSIGLGQGSGPITVKEVDGSPVCNNCRTFVFPNGSLTVSGNKVTVASGGGGITVGTTTANGTAGRVLYTDGSFVQAYTVTGSGNAVLNASPIFTTDITTPIVKSAAGADLAANATAPAATTGASQAGKAVTVTASAAVASTDTAGAAAGGNVTITAGNAARLTSGNADGGNVNLVFGAAIGTGRSGILTLGGTTTSFTGLTTTDVFGSKYVTAKLGNNTITNTGFVGSLFRINSVEGNSSTITSDYGNSILLSSGGLITWNSASSLASGSADTTFRRNAAANLAFGAADAASPVAQTISTQGSRAGTDSNVSGANLTVQSGLGTGNSTPSRLILRSPLIGSTGTTAQTATTGLTIINGTARLTSYTVATLPNPTVAGDGALAIVTDATLTAITGLGLAPTGGGANIVPVYVAGGVWLMF